ncbi:MAG: PH domain-containing protein [Acidimicrobiales bacterium]
MTFAQKNLTADETIALDLHPHWWYFSEAVASLVVAIVVGIWILTADISNDTLNKVLTALALVALVGTAGWTIIRYLKWMTTHFVITSHRLIFRTGVLAKSGIEIPLERVNNVNFNQSIFERMLGAGDLLIESGGEDGQSRFADIKHPDQVQSLIHSQMEMVAQRRAGYGRPDMAPPSVAEELERLEGMLHRGTLTPEEFEAQKRRLLG